jgi:ketosteroid isomerase-like protein
MALLSMPSWASAPVASKPGAIEPPEHAALRMLRGRLLESVNKMDVDGILENLHPNVVVTWQNAEVSRGHQGVRDYLARMTGGANPIVRSFKTDVNVDELTVLYGENTGIAFGSSTDRFDLTGGLDFTLNGRWTATLIKDKGRWLVASMHASTNLFDNPLLNIAKKAVYIGVPASFLVALAIGLFVGRSLSKRSP